MAQLAPPRYRRATPDDFFPDWVVEEARWELEHKPKPKKKRRAPKRQTELFDVTRWKLPTRWRNDKRVGDAAMAKMTAGCELPGRFDL